MASNNTSKTAHVMNLLSKNRSTAPEPPAEPAPQTAAVPQTESAAPQIESAPVHSAPVAPIISSLNADAAVSSQIKDALEAELEESVKPVPAPQAAPVQRPAPVQQPAPVQEAAPAQQPAPVQEAAPVQQPAPVQEAPVQKASFEEPPAEKPSYVNVMQILVEEKADEYMKMFGICCCDKCRVDVRAFALNHLPPKYVVLSENERIPRLTVYESRFNSDVTSQLIQACKQVMLRPHHTRENT